MFSLSETDKKSTNIKHLPSISDIDLDINSLPEGTIIGFDIDLTLVDYMDCIMSDYDKKSKYAFIDRVKEAAGKEVVEIAFTEAKSKVVEKVILNLIAKLQKSDKVTPIAFTARRTGKPQLITEKTIEDVTIELLKSIGIDFSSSFSEYSNTDLNKLVEKPIPMQNPNVKPYEQPGPPMYKEGILFSAGYEKDSVFKAFMKLVGNGKHFIMIDDNYDNLYYLSKVCEEIGIGFTGYHYTKVRDLDRKPDPDIVERQYQSLVNDKKWLTDADAAIILEEKNSNCMSLT